MPPKRDWKLRIKDILDAINQIRAYTLGMTFEQFSSDRKTVDAVIRNLEIIGEAARCVPAGVTDSNSHIPWADMRATRNVLSHVYFGVNLEIVWDTIQKNLEPLREPLAELIGEK